MTPADTAPALRASVIGVAVNAALAVVKISVGVAGSSYALIADGIESSADILSSAIVWSGLRVAAAPPDREHPYGHGRAETLAGVFVAVALIAAAALIAAQSIHQIRTPHPLPRWFTLPVLAAVIGIKFWLGRWVSRVSRESGSAALAGDAGHHWADALTSVAAFIGISIALIGGAGWESADDWAALFACLVVGVSGVRLLRPGVHDLMDGAAPGEFESRVRAIARAVPGVAGVEKTRIRRSGLGWWMDIHVEVDGSMSVVEGHAIAHAVRDALVGAKLNIADALVHIEPAEVVPVARPAHRLET